jgi:hypothetical protein
MSIINKANLMLLNFIITKHTKMQYVKIAGYLLVTCSSSKDSVCKRKKK